MPRMWWKDSGGKMIISKKLITSSDFSTVRDGDFLAVEWKLDSYIGNKRTRFAVYQVVEARHDSRAEIILQKKNNVYFNYGMFTGTVEGCSNAKSVTLFKSENEGNV